MSQPALAASITWIGFLILAAIISCWDFVNFENISDFFNKNHTVCTDVVKSAKEWTYICSACSCGKKCLCG